MGNFYGINTDNILIGIGNIYINGVPVGGTEGALVLVPQKKTKDIDNVAQKFGTTLDTRHLGNSALIRFTMLEGTLANMQKALDSSPISMIGMKSRISFGSESQTKFVPKFTFSFYCEAPNQRQRKFYAYKVGFVDPGEINFSGDDFTKIPVTLRCYPDETIDVKKNLWYMEDGPISPIE